MAIGAREENGAEVEAREEEGTNVETREEEGANVETREGEEAEVKAREEEGAQVDYELTHRFCSSISSLTLAGKVPLKRALDMMLLKKHGAINHWEVTSLAR